MSKQLKKQINSRNVLKNNVFTFALGGLIFGTFGVSAATYIYNSNQISYVDPNKEETNVKDAIDYLYEAVDNSAKPAMLFTSSPVDMKEYTDKWAELTSTDFKGGYSSVSCGAWSGGDGEDNGSSTSLSKSATVSYNNTTGILTFFAPSGSSHVQTSSWNNSVDLNMSGGAFAVWLGTINGK